MFIFYSCFNSDPDNYFREDRFGNRMWVEPSFWSSPVYCRRIFNKIKGTHPYLFDLPKDYYITLFSSLTRSRRSFLINELLRIYKRVSKNPNNPIERKIFTRSINRWLNQLPYSTKIRKRFDNVFDRRRIQKEIRFRRWAKRCKNFE